MSYDQIDPAIQAWASNHTLPVYTQYKDVEVRSVELVGVSGQKVQIWIDQPLYGWVGVHVWNYKKLRQDWKVQTNKLEATLEQAYQKAMDWIA